MGSLVVVVVSFLRVGFFVCVLEFRLFRRESDRLRSLAEAFGPLTSAVTEVRECENDKTYHSPAFLNALTWFLSMTATISPTTLPPGGYNRTNAKSPGVSVFLCSLAWLTFDNEHLCPLDLCRYLHQTFLSIGVD